MTEFVFLLLHRALAGAHNGFGYEKRWRSMYFIEFTLIGMCLAGFHYWPGMGSPRWLIAAAGILVGLGVLATLAVGDSFDPRYNIVPADVHLYELGKTGFVLLAWVLGNGDLIGICAAVYPGLILHKGFVNWGTDQNFFYYGTDDPTGATFSIPLLGWKIPRLPQWMRYVLAVLSVFGYVVASSWGWEVRLLDLWNAIKWW